MEAASQTAPGGRATSVKTSRQVRERDRYRRASVRERVTEGLRAFVHNRAAVVIVVAIVGGWLVMLVVTPKVVPLDHLAVGLCLHIPTSSTGDPGAPRAIGTQKEIAGVLVSDGAEIAPCDSSHSHEVAAVFRAPDAQGAVYPGDAQLVEQFTPACQADFATFVGRPLRDSMFELTVVVPSDASWAAGHRTGACLVSRADGRYLTSRAAGSGQ